MGAGSNASTNGSSFHSSSHGHGNNAQQQQMESGSFHPSLGAIAAILATMFALAFLVLLYVKHCRRAPSADRSIAHHHHHHHQQQQQREEHQRERSERIVDSIYEELEEQEEDSEEEGDDGRSLALLLPSFPFSSLRGDAKDGLECAICLSRFMGPELLRLLPSCRHGFHAHCVDPWLAHHRTCPLCRHRVSLDSLQQQQQQLLPWPNPSSFGLLRPPPSSSSSASSHDESFRFPTTFVDAIPRAGNAASSISSGNNNTDDDDESAALQRSVERRRDPDPDPSAAPRGPHIDDSRFGSDRSCSAAGGAAAAAAAAYSGNLDMAAGSSSRGRGWPWSSRWRNDSLVTSRRASSRVHDDQPSSSSSSNPDSAGSFRKLPAAVAATSSSPSSHSARDDPSSEHRITSRESGAQSVIEPAGSTRLVGSGEMGQGKAASAASSCKSSSSTPSSSRLLIDGILPAHLQHMDEGLARRLQHRITLDAVAGNSQQSQWTSSSAPGIMPMMPFITTGRIHCSSSSSSNRSARISTSKVGSLVVEAKEYRAITTWAPLPMPHIQRRCMSEITSLHRSSSAMMIADAQSKKLREGC